MLTRFTMSRNDAKHGNETGCTYVEGGSWLEYNNEIVNLIEDGDFQTDMENKLDFNFTYTSIKVFPADA